MPFANQSHREWLGAVGAVAIVVVVVVVDPFWLFLLLLLLLLCISCVRSHFHDESRFSSVQFCSVLLT